MFSASISDTLVRLDTDSPDKGGGGGGGGGVMMVVVEHLTSVVVTPSPGSTIPPGRLHTPLSRR